jgi:hypothetical protein
MQWSYLNLWRVTQHECFPTRFTYLKGSSMELLTLEPTSKIDFGLQHNTLDQGFRGNITSLSSWGIQYRILCWKHASSLLFIGFGNPKLTQKRSLKHARPDRSQGGSDGSSFSCPESNFGIFWRSVRMGKSFRPDRCLPDASRIRSDFQITAFFLSFPTTPISIQSDIWVKRYDQNTGRCPDCLTESPDGQLQPPL